MYEFRYLVFLGICCGLFILEVVSATCTFPTALRGVWVRGHDSLSMTFADATVSGLGITFQGVDLGDFSCETSSGNTYVVSVSYTGLLVTNKYYICWELVQVTTSAYIMYELSDAQTSSGFTGDLGFVQAAATSFTASQACTKSISTEFFTTLIKNGATSSDVAAVCPSLLDATFTYALCASTELTFCPDKTTGTADYTLCATPIFNSAGGVVSCMGYVERAPYFYVNLYTHDAGNAITCLRAEAGAGNDVSAVYYAGDCTTAGGSSTALTLTATTTCDSSSEDNSVIIIVGVVVGVVGLGVLVVIVLVFLAFFTTKNKVDHTYGTSSPAVIEEDAVVEKPENNTIHERESREVIIHETSVDG